VTVTMAVTNQSSRQLHLGAPSSCLLSFEVVDSHGAQLIGTPVFGRVCLTVITDRPIAPGDTYSEVVGWDGQIRDAGTPAVLDDGVYTLRFAPCAAFQTSTGGARICAQPTFATVEIATGWNR